MDKPMALNSLFKEKIFRIPDYQRGYAWGKKELVEFWADLVNLPDKRFHYTGVLTLQQIPSENFGKTTKEYWLIVTDSFKVYHIVDGQQRLATFIIFLQAFVDFVKKLPENKDRPDDAILITDYLRVTDVQSKYLFRIRPPDDLFRTYMFGYTADNPLSDYLQYNIFGEKGSGEPKENFYTLNLSTAKLYFKERLEELHKQEGLAGLHKIYKKLTQQFLFNEYIIENEFDVFIVFETMNNRGKKLSTLERLKNRLIYLTTCYSDEELEPDRRKNLRDTINDAWKEVYRQLGRNKEKPLDDDAFLQAHWTMYFGYSRETGWDYIRFLFDHYFSHQKVLKSIGLKVTRELPEEQPSVTDSENSEDDNGDIPVELPTGVSSDKLHLHPTDIKQFANSLKESAVHWFNSSYPDMAEGISHEEKEWIDKLNRVNITYFRPLVMAVLKNVKDESERIDIFRHIERFIFVIFRMTATRSDYSNSAFYNAAKGIDKGAVDGAWIKEQLKQRTSFIFDKDGTLRIEGFRSLLHKRFETGNRFGYYGWSGLRYFLYEYELDLSLHGHGKKVVDWSNWLKPGPDKISIEHIYPQTETDYWKEAFKDVDADKRIYYKGSLGNLLLLSQAINSALQNDSFDDKKKPKYDPHGSKIREGYVDGSHSEFNVYRQPLWGPKQIRDRGIDLLTFMEKRWDFKFRNEEDKMKVLFLHFGESNRAAELQA